MTCVAIALSFLGQTPRVGHPFCCTCRLQGTNRLLVRIGWLRRAEDQGKDDFSVRLKLTGVSVFALQDHRYAYYAGFHARVSPAVAKRLVNYSERGATILGAMCGQGGRGRQRGREDMEAVQVLAGINRLRKGWKSSAPDFFCGRSTPDRGTSTEASKRWG